MQPIAWQQEPAIPPGPAAALASLRFGRDSGTSALRDLDETEWKRTLEFCDRAQILLLLGKVAEHDLPTAIRERIHRDSLRHLKRIGKLQIAFGEIVQQLQGSKLPHLVLKGFTHDHSYAAEPRIRPQYDIDLYAPEQHAGTVRDAVVALGYEPIQELESFPMDHFPTLVRKTGWEWRGDFHDPEIPPSVEVHFRFWDPGTERVCVPGLDEFWGRRVQRELCGLSLSTLDPADTLGYAALHLLRHLFRGNIRIYNVYELAYFLNAHVHDDLFWARWYRIHPPELRMLETIAFALAQRWFGGLSRSVIKDEIDALPEHVASWMERYASAPVQALFSPKKSELWLHLSLISSFRGKADVFRRRLMPTRLPGPVHAVYVPNERMTLSVRIQRALHWSAYAGERALHHIRAFCPAIVEGTRWMFRSRGIAGGQFLLFLVAANTYNFGLFIFFLLYNLFLLDAGYREDSLGLFAGAMTFGTLTGSLPSAALCHRIGLRSSLILGCSGVALFSASRTLLISDVWLVLTAFAGGMASSLWIVGLMPSIARLLPEKQRPVGFSLWISSGVATGIAAGLLGSRLPGWIADAGLAVGGLDATRTSLLIGCAIAVCALWPVARLAVLASSHERQRRVYPGGPFIRRYLLVFGAWQLAVGAFNPLFNAYFARELQASIVRIGDIFAASQFVQAGAVLVAPVILGRAGVIGGTSAIQIAAACFLAALAVGPPTAGAAVFYAGFMSCQTMVEPGMFSILMSRVAPHERSGASGLNFFIMFGAHGIAAAVAGWAVAQAGYSAMLLVAASTAAASAMLFRLFMSEQVAEPLPPGTMEGTR